MATSETLINDAVEACALPRATIKAYVQTLRDNELIRKSGRGVNAAAMTTKDAAALLAVILANPTIAEAPEATKFALSLPARRATVNIADKFEDEFHEFAASFINEEVKRQVTTFGGMLRWLLFNAQNACVKDGDDLVDWELLFSRRTKVVEITYCRPPEIAFVAIRFHAYAAVVFEYNQLKSGEPPQIENAFFGIKESATDYPETYLASEYAKDRLVSSRSIRSPTIMAFARSVLKPIAPPRP